MNKRRVVFFCITLGSIAGSIEAAYHYGQMSWISLGLLAIAVISFGLDLYLQKRSRAH